MTTSRPFTVHLLPGLRERLDSLLGAADACRAMVQMYSVLPQLHDRRPRSDPRPDGGELPVYLGRFGWMDIGFSYVELGSTLLVLCLWPDLLWTNGRTHEVDCVLHNRDVGFLLTSGGLL